MLVERSERWLSEVERLLGEVERWLSEVETSLLFLPQIPYLCGRLFYYSTLTVD